MKAPESNGLFEVNELKPRKEYGFFCMKLASFLDRDNITEWNAYHSAFKEAQNKNCPYKEECNIYKRTINE